MIPFADYLVTGRLGEGGMATLSNAKLPADMRAWLPDPEGEGAYPIASYTWMMFYKKYDDPTSNYMLHESIEQNGRQFRLRWTLPL